MLTDQAHAECNLQCQRSGLGSFRGIGGAAKVSAGIGAEGGVAKPAPLKRAPPSSSAWATTKQTTAATAPSASPISRASRARLVFTDKADAKSPRGRCRHGDRSRAARDSASLAQAERASAVSPVTVLALAPVVR